MTDLPIADLADTLSRVLHPEYNVVPLTDAILAVDKLLGQIEEARSWARHGYEIGQRSNTWSDHGVAPAWLTEGHASVQPTACPPACSEQHMYDGGCLLDPHLDGVTAHTRGAGQPDGWAWSCAEDDGCGWLSLGHDSAAAARRSYDRHRAKDCPRDMDAPLRTPATPEVAALPSTATVGGRPRCPHCHLPHDLDGWPAEVCRRIRETGSIDGAPASVAGPATGEAQR